MNDEILKSIFIDLVGYTMPNIGVNYFFDFKTIKPQNVLVFGLVDTLIKLIKKDNYLNEKLNTDLMIYAATFVVSSLVDAAYNPRNIGLGPPLFNNMIFVINGFIANSLIIDPIFLKLTGFGNYQ